MKSAGNIRRQYKGNMKIVKRITGIILVVCIAFLYAHIDKGTAIYNRMTESADYHVIDVSQAEVEQEFVCQENMLDAIQIKLQKLSKGEDGKVTMVLMKVDTGEIVAQSSLEYGEIKNGKFNSFTFQTMKGCKGEQYKIILEDQSVAVYQQPDTEKDTELKINSEKREGTLIIKSVTHRFDVETFGVFLVLILYIGVFFQFLNRLFSR